MPRVPVVDGYRAYAILGVVTFHLLLVSGGIEQGTDRALLAWGLLGNVIDVFFIISGFGLFLAVVRRGGELGSIRDFALSRAARIAPAYWLSLLVLLGLILVLPRIGLGFAGQPAAPDLPEVLANFAALQMPIKLFDGTFMIGFGVNGALWLVSIIVGLYLVYPFITRAYYRHPLIGLAIAAAITFGWKQAVIHLPGFFRWLDQGDSFFVTVTASDQLPGWVFSFALGMTAAWAYVRAIEGGSLDRFRRPAGWIAAIALLACGVCAYLYGQDAYDTEAAAVAGSFARTSPELSIAYSLSRAVLIAAIALGPLWMRVPFDNAPARRISELSFGIYLIHMVALFYVGAALLDLPSDGSAGAVASWFAVVFSVSVAYAWVSLRFVETPAREWARARVRRRSRPVPDGARPRAGRPVRPTGSLGAGRSP